MLYIIPTPIGNFEDLTFRSLRILRESELILTEDTRTSKKLLNTLKELQNFLGSERYLVLCREISKKFEKKLRGSLREIIIYFENNTPIGEFVLVLEGLR